MVLTDENSLDQGLYENYFENLLAGNRTKCHAIVEELVASNAPVKTIYLDLFQRSMYEVGELWESNKVSVAVEHLATAITESALNILHPLIFSREHFGRKAIVSCVANEYHQIGGKIVADILELHGWDGYFLGANTPVNELMRLIEDKEPDLLCLSLAIYFNLPDLRKYLAVLEENFSSLKILVGGQAFRFGGQELLDEFYNVRYLSSLDDLEKLITSYDG